MENLDPLNYDSRMTRAWHIGRNKTFPISQRTLVMGVLNVTPDSFSDGGEFFSLDKALAHAEQMIAEGADIIDVGGESGVTYTPLTDPSAEIARVVPLVERLDVDGAQIRVALFVEVADEPPADESTSARDKDRIAARDCCPHGLPFFRAKPGSTP